MSNAYPKEFWIQRDPFADGDSSDFGFSATNHGKRYVNENQFNAMRRLFVAYVNLAQNGFGQKHGDELTIIREYEALTGRDFVADRTVHQQKLMQKVPL